MPDYTLSARITGNSDGFTKAFEGAQKTLASFEGKAKGIGSKISSVGDALTSKIAKPAAAATTALAGLTLVKGFNRLVGIDDARAKCRNDHGFCFEICPGDLIWFRRSRNNGS